MEIEYGETARLGVSGIHRLTHPEDGFLAGLPRFAVPFPRDQQRAIFMALSSPDNAFIPGFLAGAEASVAIQAKYQGTKFDSRTGETPGAIFHEKRSEKPTGVTADGTFLYNPDARLLHLEKGGWHTNTLANGTKEQLHFVAKDTTGGFLTGLALVARAQEHTSDKPKSRRHQDRDSFIEQYWPNAVAAYRNQTEIFSDGKGLIFYTPNDPNTLRHQCERDQNSTYLKQDGTEPEPPFWHASNNAHYLGGLKEMVWMAGIMGDHKLQKEAAEIYETGVERYQKIFWVKEQSYATPLVYGKNMLQSDTINDEALDGMAYGIWTAEQDKTIAERSLRPDLNHKYGFWGVSRNSKVFADKCNEDSYWRGSGSWPFRLAMAAIGFQNRGFPKERDLVAQEFIAITNIQKLSELSCITDDLRIVDYTEEGIPSACTPQLFTAAAALAIQPVKINRS